MLVLVAGAAGRVVDPGARTSGFVGEVCGRLEWYGRRRPELAALEVELGGRFRE